MQFQARRRFFPRRSFGRKNSRQVPRWTAQSTDLTLTAAAPLQFATLYSPGTTIGAGQYEEESLCLRIVGRVTAQPLAANNTSGYLGIGIIHTENTGLVAGGFQDPVVSTELAARDWMGVYNTQIPPNAGTNGWQLDQPIDIRVKRRLKGNSNILLIANQGTGVNSVVVTIDVRILIVIRL